MGRDDIVAVNAALFPGAMKTATFRSRFAGDGESGLEAYAGDTFNDDALVQSFTVAVVDPGSLASPDIVKIDIEGGEGDVLDSIDLSITSLVLLEYQNRKNRVQLEARLAEDFEVIDSVGHGWEPLLGQGCYRQDLAGDVYGRMFAVRKGMTRTVRR